MKYKKLLIGIFSLFISSLSLAQEIVSTTQGDLKIYPIRHASMVWEWNNLTIYIDPVGSPDDYSQFKSPDLVVITHSHGDHLSASTLEGIKAAGIPFIVPQDVADKLSEKFKTNLFVLANGEEMSILEMIIKAVPAYNYPITEESFHVKGVGNGYVISLGEKRVYISGDTGNIPEMKDFKEIDLAFLCMNLPYTMDVDVAAEAAFILNPKIVFPYHYRGQGGFSDLELFKTLLKEKDSAIEVRVLAWY